MIDFSKEQWEKVRHAYRNWWAGELERPLIAYEKSQQGQLPPPKMKEPVGQRHFGDLNCSTDDIAQRIVYDLSCKTYEGDAYPLCNMDFSGPGVLAAYLGGRVVVSREGMIWFYPMENRPEINKLHLSFDPNNLWYQRTVEIIRKVKALSGGNMVMGFPDLGGVMDVLSAFFPSEELFFAMADQPQEVKRLLGEIETAWYTVYNLLYQEFSGFQGYSCWSGIYSERKTYIHQCDFCYMIGPDDFDEFVLPTLKRQFVFTDDSIYHLDGKGELVHLDKILACDNLKGVQWVPGDGNGLHTDYPEVMRKILHGGKNTYVWGGETLLHDLLRQTGTLKGVYMRYWPQQGEQTDINQLFASLCETGSSNR